MEATKLPLKALSGGKALEWKIYFWHYGDNCRDRLRGTLGTANRKNPGAILFSEIETDTTKCISMEPQKSDVSFRLSRFYLKG